MQSRGARAGLLVALAAAAVALFVLLSGGDDDGGGGTTSTETTTTKPAFEVIQIENGAPVEGVRDLSYKKGDLIRLRVIPEPGVEEIHVHGYELEEVVNGTKPVDFVFTADLDGGFDVEAHTDSGEFEIARIKVEP